MTNWQSVEPRVWKPESIDDELIGVLIKVDEESGNYGSKAYFIEAEEGGYFVVFGSTVLDDKMSIAKPGRRLKIVWKGLGQSTGDKKAFKKYEVYFDKDQK